MDTNAETADTPIPPPTAGIDLYSRLFASTALGLAVLGLIELAGTVAVGLSVETDRLGFLHRQGYAFLTQLERSPVSLLLVVAAVFAALTTLRPETDSRTAKLATYALWAIVAATVLVGLGSVCAVLARFRVAELPNADPIDPVTRRVLFTFVVRNFGGAMLAMLVACGALFRPKAKPVVVA